MRVRVRGFEVSVQLPQVSRVRMVTTSSLASAFTTAWIAAPAFLPYASVDAKMVVSGVAVPFGVGYVTLLCAEYRARRELTLAVRQQPQPAEPETVPVTFVKPGQVGNALEGEVLR